MPHWTDADPLRTFDGRATLYERGRPGYPPAAIDFLLEESGSGDGESVHVADVGAGTGRLTRLFAERACPVVAIEPNSEMRAAAPPFAGVDWVDRTGEDTGLANASVNLVTVAQALHWLDLSLALPEWKRILVPRGLLAVIWNDRVKESPFESDYQGFLRELKPPERRDSPPKASVAALSGTPWFEEPALRVFEHCHLMDVEALVARTLSLSYAPTDERGRAKVEAELRALHAAHASGAGEVPLRYTSSVHFTRARA